MSLPHLNPLQSAGVIASPGPDVSDDFPYETDVFHQCWWEQLAPKFDIPFKNRELLICKKPILKGLITLREVRVAGWNNAWTQDLTAARVAELQDVDQTTAWDYLRLQWNESRQDRQALDLLADTGFLVAQLPAPVQYVIDLSDGFEGYLKSLSHNSRKSLKKKTRRGQDLNPRLEPCTTDADIDAFFAEFFSYHIPYWDEKSGRSYFNDAEERNFIIQWAKILNKSGQLVMDRLMMNDETVNMSMGIISGKTFYWLLTINSGRHSEYVPGIIGLYLRLQQAAEAGITQYKMGSGDYFYKVQSANSREICRELIVCNPRSLKGQAYYHWLQRQSQKSQAASDNSEPTPDQAAE